MSTAKLSCDALPLSLPEKKQTKNSPKAGLQRQEAVTTGSTQANGFLASH